MKFRREEIEEIEPLPMREPPLGGWRKPTCSFESHTWGLEIEDGRASITCLDPCNPDLFDMTVMPTCLHDWQPEDYCTPNSIPVRLMYVDDSTPSTPTGPAEWGYYIEVHPFNR